MGDEKVSGAKNEIGRLRSNPRQECYVDFALILLGDIHLSYHVPAKVAGAL